MCAKQCPSARRGFGERGGAESAASCRDRYFAEALGAFLGRRIGCRLSAPHSSEKRVIGLQFKRRFWEEDEQIYGGITYTDLPIWQIGYPNTSYGSSGKGVVLGAYVFDSPYAYEFTALPPEDRLKKAVEYGAQIHPQYETDYENGIAVGWHRVPWVLGCFGRWTEEARKQNLCAIDGRSVLAGEHVSNIPAWQEGAVLSSLDAISRLHRRVVAS
jgi:monoamine oxidase